MDCPSCGETAPESAKWCEACGSDLHAEPTVPCTACGERDISDDGYCMSCGHKQPAERDHMEFLAGPIAAVTDRGVRHRHNEDATAIGQLPGGGVVLVVCDGVSSTPGSAEASLDAASAACELLIEQLHGPAPTRDEIAEGLEAATKIAQDRAAASPEVTSNAPYADGGPPSSTFVASVAIPSGEGVVVSTAWLGDSRAYWIEKDEAVQLTEDHEIEGSLTRWLGADSMDALPDLSHFEASQPGRLMLCSDGLWRYADSPLELLALIRRLESEHTTTKALAGALVDHAIASGGHDNITVALWASWLDEQDSEPEAEQSADVEETAQAEDVQDAVEAPVADEATAAEVVTAAERQAGESEVVDE